MWHKENTLLIASRHAHALKSLQALQTPHLARRSDDDDCCLFSHEKTLGLFDRKKTTQKQKEIETTIIKTFTTSPNSNEILVKYKTQVKGSWKTFSHNKS